MWCTCISVPDVDLMIANSVVSDEMQHIVVFIWHFTIYQSTHLRVSSIQRVKVIKKAKIRNR